MPPPGNQHKAARIAQEKQDCLRRPTARDDTEKPCVVDNAVRICRVLSINRTSAASSRKTEASGAASAPHRILFRRSCRTRRHAQLIRRQPRGLVKAMFVNPWRKPSYEDFFIGILGIAVDMRYPRDAVPTPTKLTGGSTRGTMIDRRLAYSRRPRRS